VGLLSLIRGRSCNARVTAGPRSPAQKGDEPLLFRVFGPWIVHLADATMDTAPVSGGISTEESNDVSFGL